MLKRKTPIEKEIASVVKKEEEYIRKHYEENESFINRKLEEKVPENFQSRLDSAFSKAFALVFQKGTGVIEKTYSKEKHQRSYMENEELAAERNTRKNLRAFKKNAARSGGKNLVISGVEGVGLGLLGIGLPDIPVFVAVILKSVYETALHYGYDYEGEEERYFILKLIETALSRGSSLEEKNKAVEIFLEKRTLPESYRRDEQIELTSSMLSKELLYMKFLQGIPVAGVIGGIYDSVYLNRILRYARLKYRKRFLLDRLHESNK